MTNKWDKTWGKLDWENTKDDELVKQVTKLVKEGADMGATDKDGNTILHLAAKAGRLRTVKKIIDLEQYYLADVTLLDHRNNEGQLPLHLGAMSGVAGVVKLLNKERPANEEPDIYGNIPMHYAKNPATVRALLSERPFIVQKAKITSYANNEGKTPLHTAVERDDTATARALIDNHSDVNARDERGYTPLNTAIEMSSVKMIKEILAPNNGYHGKYDLNALVAYDSEGNGYDTIIPLVQLFDDISIARKDKMTIAKLMIDNGAKLKFVAVEDYGDSWNNPITYINDKAMEKELINYARKVEEGTTTTPSMAVAAVRRGLGPNGAEM